MFLSFRTISVRTIIAERFLRGIVSVECSKSFSINTTHAMAYSSSSFSNSGDGESDSNSNDSAHNSTEYDHRYGGLDENQFRHLFGDSSNLIKDFYQPQLRELKKGSLKVSYLFHLLICPIGTLTNLLFL